MIGRLLLCASAALALAIPGSAQPVTAGAAEAGASASMADQSVGKSVLRGNIVVRGPLHGLTLGTTVIDTAGHPVGQVERILTRFGGSVRLVLVRSASGKRVIPIKPDDLSFDAETLVATTRFVPD